MATGLGRRRLAGQASIALDGILILPSASALLLRDFFTVQFEFNS